LFVNAQFASPVTQDRISKLERFQITVDVANTRGIDGK
jgi:general secretion pathway protein L